MRLSEEVLRNIDELEEEESEADCDEGGARRVIVVGYALTPKKIRSFMQPKLEKLARSKGIQFVAINQNRPLSDQGPFDVIMHKLRCKEWCQVLEEFMQDHPEVTILDPPNAIDQLRNRESMLKDVDDMKLSVSCGKSCMVGVPRQLVITSDASSIPEIVANAGLSLPLVAKPLVADQGRPVVFGGLVRNIKCGPLERLSQFYQQSQLDLLYHPSEFYNLQHQDYHEFYELEPPLVLQEFVNHGGILFKVYVVGEAIKVVRRFSLPDVTKSELSKISGVFRFPRVSCASESAEEAELDPEVAELPPQPLLERLARELRLRLGLQLFNLDIIREHGTRDRFYVIDINYFPGYGKMPDYEHIFTDFLLSFGQSNNKKVSADNIRLQN